MEFSFFCSGEKRNVRQKYDSNEEEAGSPASSPTYVFSPVIAFRRVSTVV